MKVYKISLGRSEWNGGWRWHSEKQQWLWHGWRNRYPFPWEKEIKEDKKPEESNVVETKRKESLMKDFIKRMMIRCNI